MTAAPTPALAVSASTPAPWTGTSELKTAAQSASTTTSTTATVQSAQGWLKAWWGGQATQSEWGCTRLNSRSH
eukprot:7642896-Pyramimonas_sp.AAC.1